MESAEKHCAKGIGTWDFVSNDPNPDIIMACAGDTPTVEVIAAKKIMDKFLDINLSNTKPFVSSIKL